MTNSALQEFKLNELLSEIKLSVNKNKVLILLEGKNDIKLFKKIFSSSHVKKMDVHGRYHVIKALKTIKEKSLFKIYKIIGIKDADFDNLECTNYPKNLFITDYHDIEVQMIESDAITTVVDDFSSAECREILQSNIKNIIYDIAINIGYARWFNEKEKNRNSKGLKFRKLNFEKFTESKDCNIVFNYDNFLKTLLYHSNSTIPIEKLKNELKLLKDDSKDFLQICNGHDLTKLIAIIFPNNTNQKKVEDKLIEAYKINYFEQTKLFKNLNAWCDSANCKIFKTA